jgi:hypothetical protein
MNHLVNYILASILSMVIFYTQDLDTSKTMYSDTHNLHYIFRTYLLNLSIHFYKANCLFIDNNDQHHNPRVRYSYHLFIFQNKSLPYKILIDITNFNLYHNFFQLINLNLRRLLSYIRRLISYV